MAGGARRPAYRATIENLRDVAAKIVVEDRVPVSEDERIRVEIGDPTTKGYARVADRPGIVKWALTLASKDLAVPGL